MMFISGLKRLFFLLRLCSALFLVAALSANAEALMAPVSVVGAACRNSEKFPPTRMVDQPGGGFREMAGEDFEIIIAPWNNVYGVISGRTDIDGDGVCDSIIVEPGGEGVGGSQERGARERIVFVHGEQVRRIKPNISANALQWFLPLYSEGPPVFWEYGYGYFSAPKMPRAFYRWNRELKQFDTLSAEQARPYAHHVGLLLYTIAQGGMPVEYVNKIRKPIPPWDRIQSPSSPLGPGEYQRIAELIEGRPVSFDFNEGSWTPEQWLAPTRHLAFRSLLVWHIAEGGRSFRAHRDARLSRVLGYEYIVSPVLKELNAQGVRNALVLLKTLRAEFPKAPEIAFMQAIVAMQAWKEQKSLLGWKYKNEFPDPRQIASAALADALANYKLDSAPFSLEKRVCQTNCVNSQSQRV